MSITSSGALAIDRHILEFRNPIEYSRLHDVVIAGSMLSVRHDCHMKLDGILYIICIHWVTWAWFTAWWKEFRFIYIDFFFGLDWKREKVRLPDGTERWQGSWERIRTKGRKNLEWQVHNRVWGLDDSKDIVRWQILKSHPSLSSLVAVQGDKGSWV